MIALLERLLPLWTQPVDARDDPEAAFGQVYANPVSDGIISAIWVVSDDLGLLRQLDAVSLA